MIQKLVRERQHRLPPECYHGLLIVHFTACIKNKVSFFTTQQIFNSIEEILLDVLPDFHVDAEVYLFMPDHCHLLLKGTEETSDVLKCMNKFKQKSGYWLSQRNLEIRWQKDFYDHILRREEDKEKLIWYILNNPVRKDLVESWKEYPYKGSTCYDFNEWD